MWEQKCAQMFQVTRPYMVKTLKNLLLWNHKYMYYQVCSNDDPELTLTYFTTRSNLVLYAFVWDKGMKVSSNGPGHITSMAAMPIYGKNLKKYSSLEPNSR